MVLMFQHTKRASEVEIVLLTNNFSIVRYAVSEMISPWILDKVATEFEVIAIQVILLGAVLHNNLPISHIVLSVFRYIVVGQKNNVCAFHPSANLLVYQGYLIGKIFESKCSLIWGSYYMSTIHVYSCVLMNGCIVHSGQIVLLYHWLSVSRFIYLNTLVLTVTGSVYTISGV